MVPHGGVNMVVYKIIDIVGISETSFADAAKNAVDEAAKTVRGIKRAEVAKFDLKVDNDQVAKYRAEVKVSFEIQK